MKILNIKVNKSYNKSIKQIFFEILFIDKYANKILNAIDFGLKNDLVSIHIFKIEYKNKKYDFKLHRNHWDIILNILLKYYINIEKYENCILIKNLISYE